MPMSSSVYAAGFIYNPHTDEILLYSSEKDPSKQWNLLEIEVTNSKHDPKKIFHKTIDKMLGVKVKPEAVYFVYDYTPDRASKHTHIYYVELPKSHKKPKAKKGDLLWTTFKQINKLNISTQTKQDLTVSLRVIQAKIREKQASEAPKA